MIPKSHGTNPFAALLVILVTAGSSGAYAQERQTGEDREPSRPPVREKWSRDTGRQNIPPGDRDFERPDPDRPWGRPRYLDNQRWDRRYDYSPGYGRPRYYYDDFTYRFGVPRYDDPYAEELERAYRQGIADGRNYERFDIQAERGFATYQQAMNAGHASFAASKYGAAARQFLLAATMNQGDPTSRICAANAHIAVGSYEPAFRLLRRAFDLQPRLVYLPMDIRNAYGSRADFMEHVKALTKAAREDAANDQLWFLLGYCHYYSNNMPKAAAALAKAAEFRPDDELIRQLAGLAKLNGSEPEKTPPKRKAKKSDKHDL